MTHAEGWPTTSTGLRSVYELAGALQRAGQTVSVLTSGPAASHTKVGDVEVQCLPARGRRIPFGAQALGHIAHARADVWHAMGTEDAAAAGALGVARRHLCTVFTDPTLCDRPSRIR